MALASTAWAGPGPLSGEAGGELDSRVAALLRSVEAGTDVEGAVAELLELGPPVQDALFDVWVAGRLLGDAGAGDASLSGAQGRSVLEGLVKSCRARLPGFLVERAADGTAERVGALRIVERLGGAAQVPLLVELAAPARGEGTAPPAEEVCDAFEEALAALLRRGPRSFSMLETCWPIVPEGLRASAVRAIGASGDGRGLSLLADLARWSEANEGLLVSQIGRLAPHAAEDQVEPIAELLCAHLASDTPGLRRAAALALGRLGALRALPELIQLLEDEHAGVRQGALWSLRELSGLSLPASAAHWRNWYRSELEWFRERAQDEIAALASDDAAAVGAAIASLCRRPLFRRPIHERIAPLFAHDDAVIRGLAAEAFGRLGLASGLARLVEALEDPEERVRDAAWRSLKTISGLDLPPERKTWRAAISPESSLPPGR